MDTNENDNHRNKRGKKTVIIIVCEILILLLLIGSYRIYVLWKEKQTSSPNSGNSTSQDDKSPAQANASQNGKDNPEDGKQEEVEDELSAEEIEAVKEQERLMQEEKERQELINQADQLALSYDYEGAIELLKKYQGTEGSYEKYTTLVAAVERLEKEKSELLLYGGSYQSVSEINHIFFHALVADNSKAFDGDRMSRGYNMYMTTISEFKKMMQKMYEDGYVLVRMADLVKKVTKEDGTTIYEEGEIYLPAGKKPFVLSEDDVNYYEYMETDGFATRIVIGEDGKPTCEMRADDGSIITGDFDIVPILDAFVEEHPDFSYKGAKGLLAITGYEGTLGYRTNDPESPTYEQDVEQVKKVAQALKEDGWELGSHSWGHLNMTTASFEVFKKDTDKWMAEVGSLIGPTEIYVFPFGADIEVTTGSYSGEKFQYMKECGFTMFCGVYKSPWMYIKDDYMRMTRRPLDGQAMLEFPERLSDLFDVKDIIDPERPAKDW